MKNLRVSAGVLTRDGGEFLLGQRPKGKAFAGYWEFPGGKLEAGETEREALDRELNEELGIEVVEAKLWRVEHAVYPHASIELNFFHVSQWKNDPWGKEGQRIIWETLPLLNARPILPANKVIIEAMKELLC